MALGNLTAFTKALTMGIIIHLAGKKGGGRVDNVPSGGEEGKWL